MDILDLKKIVTDGLSVSIIDNFNTTLIKIFEDIEKQYEIPKKDLEERYLIGTINETETKTKKPKTLDIETCCLARKQDGGQCTRRRKDGQDYCGKHLVQRKYGRIDDNEIICTTETTHISEDKVATWEEKFGDKIFHRDINNIVYDREKIIGKIGKDGTLILVDENCKKIGKMLKDGTIVKII
jgi:hypothetical protein